MRARRGEGCRNPEVSSNAVQISKTEEIIDRVDGDMGGVGERREQVAVGLLKGLFFLERVWSLCQIRTMWRCFSGDMVINGHDKLLLKMPAPRKN